MSTADIPLGMCLREEAGWNQTRNDWLRFLNLQPAGCFVAELDGRAVGTVTTCVFDDVGWIAMMLVEKRCRGRGIGRDLMQAAMDYLTGHGVAAIRLDATALGQPLYAGLGFVGQFRLLRYAGVVRELPPLMRVRSLERRDWEQVFLLDKAAVGYDRQRLIERLRAEPGSTGFIDCGDESGKDERGKDGRGKDERAGAYGLARSGSLATFVGPCIANCSAAGRRVLSSLLIQFSGRDVFVDVPQSNDEARELLHNAGLEPSRELLRMCRGRPICERVDRLWASSGPEKG